MWAWLYFLSLHSFFVASPSPRNQVIPISHLFFASNIKHGQRVHLWTICIGKLMNLRLNLLMQDDYIFSATWGSLLVIKSCFVSLLCGVTICAQHVLNLCQKCVVRRFVFFTKRWVFCVSISESVQLFTPCTLSVWMDLCLLVMLLVISCSLTGFYGGSHCNQISDSGTKTSEALFSLKKITFLWMLSYY